MRVAAALGITAAFLAFVVLRTDEHAEFALHDAIVLVRVVHHLFANLHVFLKRLVARVNHYTRKPFIDALLAKLEGITVVEMDGNGNIGKADSGFDEFFEIEGIGVLASAFGNLEHDRSFFLLASLDDGLQEFHIVDVEGAQGVFALEGLGEKLASMSQWHKNSDSGSNDGQTTAQSAGDNRNHAGEWQGQGSSRRPRFRRRRGT